ncbi:glycoside hydrolase family 130 protein [Cellulomonas sp. ACRRI]|uniref:glycoside hydrolase family 130 protein n=1 Tax=Cellulomonas sp. ACRRI TaxID=2918188 RepID=UPI001EF171F1|nr:glycoside hydrolase family 130 protein [Cellulomonas sp. ACRRI]MCG7285706.1 glycoside hydrolase family 130 protein [Cellulomonas sp. ACRRI]
MTVTTLFTGATFPLGPFVPYEGNPVLRPRGGSWESANLYNPAALVVDDEVVLLYRAHAEDIVSHIGLARSRDGYHFEREAEPILSPQEDYEEFGCEDPRIAYVEGTYYLTYTGWDRKAARLCLATSTDLRTWTRHGPLFPGFDTFATVDPRGHEWSKAGVIVPVKMQGRWWMYFGEGGLYWATSDDLIRWTPGTPDTEPMYAPTPGSFDADLVEIGTSPVLTDNGLLVMLTNGATRTVHDDGTVDVDYRCGQIAIDPDEPTRVLARLQEPWLRPQTFEDRNGLVSNVTFVEGLVQFHGTWFAYYGQSDTTLAVAVHDPARPWGSSLRG